MSDSEEEVIRYGTPLDPYDEDEIPTKKKCQQQSDQYALDSHGRRRFHGAFTAGFSAGYGNTVGTPEGWTPTSFKSSRSAKAAISSLKPEDYMDDEDRSEFGIAPRHMITQEGYSGVKRPRQNRYHDQTIPGVPVLEQLVRAVHETAAVKMLKAMGWRERQGVGARITRKQKKKNNDQHKVYGCYMPREMIQNTDLNADEDSTDSEFEYDTLFAPDDYEPYVLNRKDDRFGLGYSGLSRHSVLGSMSGEYGNQPGTSKSHLLMNEKGKKVSIRGQAFGVSVLEADDEDIYATEDMSHYDFTIGGVTDPKQKCITKKKRGGNTVLEGFVKAKNTTPTAAMYPPPALPRDFVPGKRATRFDTTTHEPRDQGLGRHELTAKARGELLGETPLPKTVETELIQEVATKPPADNPVAKLLGRTVNFNTTNKYNNDKELDFISIKDSGKELKNVFKPFLSNLQKQRRYESYLQDKDSMLKKDGGTDRLTEWEREREMVEFEQAAKLYRPLTGVMGDRFTHASEPDEGALNPLCAVAKSVSDYGLTTREQVEAAQRSVYGIMTRLETFWRPESLVCKRFNVPDPSAGRSEMTKVDKPKVSYSIFSYMESSVHNKDTFAKEQSKFSGSKSLDRENSNKIKETSDHSKIAIDNINEEQKIQADSMPGLHKRMTTAELFLKESERVLENKNKESEVTETINKFDKMDLYKSIFLSDTENEDDVDVYQNKDTLSDFIDAPKNIERNLSPPRGIFANIDFDELNSWKRNIENKPTDNDKESQTKGRLDSNMQDVVKNNGQEQESTIYGPKIPDEIKKKVESSTVDITKEAETHKHVFTKKNERDKTINVDSSSSSDSWVDVKDIKKKVKKKKKKHKVKHKKSKHKKKTK